MKKSIFTLFVAFMATMAVKAQQISVVSNGETSLFSTLQDAINGAQPGSVIYLPGGGFPIADEVKITKKLTIIGIGHKVQGENADGYTTISGNLFFDKGSDNSAVMGVYMTGDVHIGNDGNQVDGVLVRYCNLNAVQVKNSKCLGTVVNQNYIRSTSSFSGSRAEITNNVLYRINGVSNGLISYNVCAASSSSSSGSLENINSSEISYNVFLNDWPYNIKDCLTDENMGCNNGGYGDNPIKIEEEPSTNNIKWSEFFVNNAGVTPQSDYHFKDKNAKYNSQCGIYAGTGFSDTALPPVPYIVAKQIPMQTDANGKLNIKIRVNAGQ